MQKVGKFSLLALVFLITLEVCIRIGDWYEFDAPLIQSYSLDQLYTTGTDGRVRGRPLGRYKNWQLNSLGLRGPELAQGTTRILCIGASETFGMLESPGKEYPRQLQDILNASNRGQFAVANLSYFGLRLPTAQMLLPAIYDQVRPAIAVIYPSFGGYVARQTLDGGDAELTVSHEVLRLPGRLSDLAKQFIPLTIQDWLRDFSIRRYVKGRAVVKHMPPNRAEFLRDDLTGLTTALRAEGAEPVLVTHANRFYSNTNAADRARFLTAWRKVYPLYSESTLLEMEDQLNDVIREFATQNNVLLVDAAISIAGGPENFTDHVHFTDKGAGLLAGLIAARLQPLLTRSQGAGAAGTAP